MVYKALIGLAARCSFKFFFAFLCLKKLFKKNSMSQKIQCKTRTASSYEWGPSPPPRTTEPMEVGPKG